MPEKRTYYARISTEPVEGDPEDWQYHLAVALRDNKVQGVEVESFAWIAEKSKGALSLTLLAESGYEALGMIYRQLEAATREFQLLKVRRIDMYPDEDQAEKDAEWQRELDDYFDELRADAMFDDYYYGS